MQISFGSKDSRTLGEKTVVTIGNFDGLHLGHRKIISRVCALGKEAGAKTVVVTFDPHPRQVLFPEQGLKRLFPVSDLEEQLAQMGVDVLAVEPFSRALSQLSPERFFNDHILRPYAPVAMVVGYDFSFGADRQGTLGVLKQLAESNGVQLEVIPPLKVGDIVVSSSRIRRAVIDGEVELAHQMLGRPYSIEGIIERGAGRGKGLGFPTANIHTSSEVLPENGVYAGWVFWKGQRLKAVTNVGTNPTFHSGGDQAIKIESHVLDFTSDLYGETLKLEFWHRLRGEMKFASVELLKEQIQRDVKRAQELLR